MKKFIISLFAVALLGCCVASAQTEKYKVTESGWGRPDFGMSLGAGGNVLTMTELPIHRWRKTKGEAVLDMEERQLTFTLPRKEIFYHLLTESYVHKDRNGWSYVDYLALENDVTLCHVWVCTHEDGSRQICIVFNNFVQGYRITSL